MTGKQRIMAALDFKQSDKVPLDINAHRCSGINVIAYRRLREYLGLPESPLYIYDFAQQLAVVETDVLDFFDADTFQLECGFYRKPEYWQDWRLEDGTVCKVPASIDQCQPVSFDFKSLKEIAEITRDSTDRAVYGDFGGSLVEKGISVFGMEDFLCELLENADQMHKFFDSVTGRHIENLKLYLDAAGNYIDIIGFNDDMGTQHAPLFSPDVYMEFFYPRQKMMWSYIHEHYPRLKVSLHCCGSVRPLMPLFIDAGLDAINPVQLSCKDMNLVELKKEFAGKLTLWGAGCDSKFMLPDTKPDEIERHVRENIEILNRDGGFVFQPVHNILFDMPAENIVKMYKSVREYKQEL